MGKHKLFKNVSKKTSLYTYLNVSYKGKKIEFSATDILLYAMNITSTTIDHIQLQPEGDGTIENPYRLTTPQHWLGAATKKSLVNKIMAFTYYHVGNRLLSHDHTNWYISDLGLLNKNKGAMLNLLKIGEFCAVPPKCLIIH
jgi:hypothetical protein